MAIRHKVLFLCTGSSCRSQMAEAIVNNRLGETWQAMSAGTKPVGHVHPKTLAELAEIGIWHEGRSKMVDEYQGVEFDLVITVCDSAAEECPIWLGKGKRVHRSFPDPAKTDDWPIFALYVMTSSERSYSYWIATSRGLELRTTRLCPSSACQLRLRGSSLSFAGVW